VKAKILVLHGADDKFVTPEQIGAFKQEMKNAGADFQFISYPGLSTASPILMLTNMQKNSICPLAITRRRTRSHGKN